MLHFCLHTNTQTQTILLIKIHANCRIITNYKLLKPLLVGFKSPPSSLWRFLQSMSHDHLPSVRDDHLQVRSYERMDAHEAIIWHSLLRVLKLATSIPLQVCFQYRSFLRKVCIQQRNLRQQKTQNLRRFRRP